MKEPLPITILQEAVIRVQEAGSIRKAAKSLGIPESTLRSRLTQAKKAGITGYVELEKDVKTDAVVITGKSYTIRTLESALKEADVNMDEWEVERHVINKWDMGAKTETKNIDKRWLRDITVVELWQVKIWLKKKIINPVEDAIDRMVNKMADWKPLVKTNHPDIKGQRHLLEIALFDAHFGKLAWGVETGTDYDIKVADRIYCNAAEDLIQRVSGYEIEQILFPIGNDFFHINNWRNTTEHGTQLDVDTRMSKIFEIGSQAIIRCIERCLEVAPVNVIWVPGNHDRETSWYLAKFLEAWYRNIPEVRVNKDPELRKYVGYGINLIGFTHGDEESQQSLPTLMATERPDLWAKATTRSWHIGHLHKKRETRYSVGDTFQGVSVHVLPSLSGTDAWHYRKGFVKGNRAAEAWLWSYTDGYVGHFNTNARFN